MDKEAQMTEAQVIEELRALRRHLKGQSKNQLITSVLQLMQALMEANRINKFLNQSLKDKVGAEAPQESSSAQSTSK